MSLPDMLIEKVDNPRPVAEIRRVTIPATGAAVADPATEIIDGVKKIMPTPGLWNCAKHLETDIHTCGIQGGGSQLRKSYMIDTIAWRVVG